MSATLKWLIDKKA